MKKLITAVLFLFATSIAAEQSSLTVKVEFKGEGELYLFIVDEAIFPHKGKGIYSAQKAVSDRLYPTGEVEFTFNNIPHGEYGIRSYIDENENATLDRGIFGPKEPWGMSFSGDRSMGPPDFSQICFTLNSDITKMIIVK